MSWGVVHMLLDWCRYFRPYLSTLNPTPCPNYLKIAPIVKINDRKLPKKSTFWKRYYPSEITRERKIEALNIRETDKKNGSEGVRVQIPVHKKKWKARWLVKLKTFFGYHEMNVHVLGRRESHKKLFWRQFYWKFYWIHILTSKEVDKQMYTHIKYM